MFTVYLKSWGGLNAVNQDFIHFETEEEAEDFCREFGWQWEDDNGFVWDMDYREEEE